MDDARLPTEKHPEVFLAYLKAMAFGEGNGNPL